MKKWRVLMGNLVRGLFHTAYNSSAYYPKEYEKEVKQELISLNIKRARILSVLLLAFILVIVGCMFLVNNQDVIDKYLSRKSLHIHLSLIVLTTLFLVLTSNVDGISRGNFLKFNIINYSLVFAVMLFCALIAVNNELDNQRPLAYIIAMYSIASVIILDKNERFVLYFSTYSVYIFGSISILHAPARIAEILIFSFPLLLLALVGSSINYSSFIANFTSRKLIQQKSIQLDKMYKAVEEALTVRTEQLNHAMEMDKLRTAFLTNISHELRTPLNVINSAEQILHMICKDEDIQNRRSEILRYNDMVEQNCQRLIRLIENLIDITEIQSGQIDMKLGQYDIVRLVREVTLGIADYMKDRNIHVSFASSLENKVITCDEGKLERVMLNLLSNAVKFTDEGGTIRVELHECAGKVIIRVRDTGIGIPNKMKDQVFEPFVQVDRSTSRLREGSGVGLTIAKAFVELHKGDIQVLSEEGRGSEFIIQLPSGLSCHAEEEINTDDAGYRYMEKIKKEFSDFYN